MTTVVCVYGYSVFLPGNFNAADFLTYYAMALLFPILYFGWKITKRTKFVKPHEADLVWEKPGIDAYEAMEQSSVTPFFTEIAQIFGLRKRKVASPAES